MGKGDKKSGKGKRFQGSYGKTRPRKKKKSAAPAAAKKKAAPKKAKKA
jgi:30S ribosomal protein S31